MHECYRDKVTITKRKCTASGRYPGTANVNFGPVIPLHDIWYNVICIAIMFIHVHWYHAIV